MKVSGEIYCITNSKNGKKYIGQTLSHRTRNGELFSFGYKKRFIEHLTKDRQTKYLSEAIELFGKDNFVTERLLVCDVSELNEKETEYIRKYNTLYPNGYNGTDGGRSIIPCDDMKKRISATLKKYYSDSDTRMNHSKVHLNKFVEVNNDLIDEIEICSINENTSSKIVYMYIKYNNNDQRIRRRYGGIHCTFDESVARCKKDALELVDNDDTKIVLNLNDDDRYTNKYKLMKNKIHGNVTHIKIMVFKTKDKKLTAVHITTDKTKSYNEKVRFVFGGKTFTQRESYEQSMEFVNKIKHIDTIIEDTIIDNLKLI